jgi:hypothetical protein
MNFKPFDNSTKNFFDDGFIEGFNLFPDSKHTILRQGLLDYYHTYHAFTGNMYEYIHKYPNGKIESSRARGHDFLTRYFSAVSFVQLFIELYVKEILEKINPILILGKLNQNEEEDFINYICNDISRFKPFSGDRTVPFSVALNRLIALINSNNIIPEHYRVPEKFHLFAENFKMLTHFATIRNSINHRGNQVMSRYAFELFLLIISFPLLQLC